jgi:hypothetical protein
MKWLNLFMWFIGISFGSSAQGLLFDNTEHTLPTIKEVDGEVTYNFSYENKSKTTISITNITVSQHAVVRPDWNRNPIAHKEKGSIGIILNPRGLSGEQHYAITVSTMENNVVANYTLKLNATVEPRPKTKEEIYGMMEGNVRYKTNTFRYILNPTSVIVDTFAWYNVYGDTLTLSYNQLPASVKILSMPSKIAPKEEGGIVFQYHAAEKNDWGNVWDKVVITTNDTNRPAKALYITGEIYDDFDVWTPQQKANAPKASFDAIEYQFGTTVEGNEVNHGYVITNIGKSTLYIRKLKQSCGCTVATPEKNELEPGDSTVIRATFRTYGKTGKQLRTIDVITNDPTQAKITLKITGMVNPKPATTE